MLIKQEAIVNFSQGAYVIYKRYQWLTVKLTENICHAIANEKNEEWLY